MKPGQFPATPLWWEIIYISGSRVRGTTLAEWQAAPGGGVLVVRQPMEETYSTPEGGTFHFTVRCHSHDYYWLDGDGHIEQGNAQAAAIRSAAPSEVKRGAWAERDEFRAAFEAIGHDVLFSDEPA